MYYNAFYRKLYDNVAVNAIFNRKHSINYGCIVYSKQFLINDFNVALIIYLKKKNYV